MTQIAKDEEATRLIGRELGARLSVGDVVLFYGELGAGKTTMIRGLLEGLGHVGPVRSPTFNLLQVFPTHPPVLHADLYRLKNTVGTGIEDYFETHACLIEWPERLGDLIEPSGCWRVRIEFDGEGRRITIDSPSKTESGIP